MSGEAMPEWLSDVSGGCRMQVRLTPRAGANSIADVRNGRLQVRVTAAPEDGKANAAACKLIAKSLRVGRTSVSVSSGSTSRDKTLEVVGLTAAEVADALAS